MKKPDQIYIAIAVYQHWNDNPRDKDIPFIGLSTEVQNRILDRAQLIQTQDEPHRLMQLLTYAAVQQ